MTDYLIRCSASKDNASKDSFVLQHLNKNPQLSYHNKKNITMYLTEQCKENPIEMDTSPNNIPRKSLSNNNITQNNSGSNSFILNDSSKQILPPQTKQSTKRRRGFQIDMSKLESSTQNDDNTKKSEIAPDMISKCSKRTTQLSTDSSSFQKNKYKHYMTIILTHNVTVIVLFILTLFAMFMSDLRVLCGNPVKGILFQILNGIIMLIFVVEFIGMCFIKEKYILSMMFFLDIFCIISVIGDVKGLLRRIVNLIFNDDGIKYAQNMKQLKLLLLFERIIHILKTTQIIKIYKFILMIRKRMEINKKMKEIQHIIHKREERERKRIKDTKASNSFGFHRKFTNNFINGSSSKLSLTGTNNTNAVSNQNYNSVTIDNKNNNSVSKFNPKLRFSKVFDNTNSSSTFNLPNTGRENNDTHEAALIQFTKHLLYKERKKMEVENETQISKIVGTDIIKQVFILVFLLLLINPIFDDDNVFSLKTTSSYKYICELVNHHIEIYQEDDTSNIVNFINRMIEGEYKEMGKYILLIKYKEQDLYINEHLRSKIKQKEEIGYVISENSIVFFSLYLYNRISSLLNVLRMICIGSILLLLSFLIVNDTQESILTPLDMMINTVNVVAKDPVNFQSIEKLNQSMTKYLSNKKKKIKKNNEYYISYEIKTIQVAIIRISTLMAIGFGEAGGQILKENMNSSEGLNPMIPGKKINAIFGFCLIRNFQQINEALQEKTIVFVNEIASIVHTNVTKFGGVCNKNIGESFLLVWKFPNEPVTPNLTNKSGFATQKNGSPFLNSNNSRIESSQRSSQNNYSLTADCALLSFLNVIKKISKSRHILNYQNEPELQKISRNNKFKLKMGFGLHVGWGIEGAIGSFYKIDCSYLSPNVNIAARLETATNIYGVDILLSGEFFSLLSVSLQMRCRLIDCVTLKGSNNPVKLYTVDVNKNIPKGKIKKSAYSISSKDKRLKNDMKKKQLFADYKKTGISIDKLYLENSKGLRNLLKNPKSELFRERFKKGYDLYIKGLWDEAYTNLKEAIYIDWSDGPTNALLKYIEKNNKRAPDDWKGYRALSAKF